MCVWGNSNCNSPSLPPFLTSFILGSIQYFICIEFLLNFVLQLTAKATTTRRPLRAPLHVQSAVATPPFLSLLHWLFYLMFTHCFCRFLILIFPAFVVINALSTTVTDLFRLELELCTALTIVSIYRLGLRQSTIEFVVSIVNYFYLNFYDDCR